MNLEGTPTIKFIKLGDGGKWEDACINKQQVIRLGYESPFHEDSLKGNWEQVWDFWLIARKNKRGPASSALNQIKDFYEQPEDTIWITFHKGLMYWCQARAEVTLSLDKDCNGARERKAIDGWSCRDLNGKLLSMEAIDGRVTKVQGYRGTICSVNQQEYLLRKIRGEIQPEIIQITESLSTLEKQIEGLIKGLWWHDFEILVDLIFSQLGWQRVSVLAKREKDIDLDLMSPITQERAFVQIKSSTNEGQIKDYIEKFTSGYKHYDLFYFVYHTLNGSLDKNYYQNKKIRLWDSSKLAQLVIKAGLVDWLIAKRS